MNIFVMFMSKLSRKRNGTCSSFNYFKVIRGNKFDLVFIAMRWTVF